MKLGFAAYNGPCMGLLEGIFFFCSKFEGYFRHYISELFDHREVGVRN